MPELLSTKQVAEYLNINEKMVYTLISDKGLPATKVTGKWLFPLDLVRQWIEAGTVNYPKPKNRLPPYHGLILISGSNDLLLEQTIAAFNSRSGNCLALFGFSGSMGGLKALRNNLCHMASSHLVADDFTDYNFPFLSEPKEIMPAVVNFCRRQQGIFVQKGNPQGIRSIADLARPNIRVVNRGLETGTRRLFEKELKKAGLKGSDLTGFNTVLTTHMDVGISVLKGEADAGPGIKPVAERLDLDFIPVCWERFDLLVAKDRFFDQGIQLFLGMLKEESFHRTAERLGGYDLSMSGNILYPEAGTVETVQTQHE